MDAGSCFEFTSIQRIIKTSWAYKRGSNTNTKLQHLSRSSSSLLFVSKMRFSLFLPLLLLSIFDPTSGSSGDDLEIRADRGHTNIKIQCTTALGTRKQKHVATSTFTKIVHKPAYTVTATKTPTLIVTPDRKTGEYRTKEQRHLLVRASQSVSDIVFLSPHPPFSSHFDFYLFRYCLDHKLSCHQCLFYNFYRLGNLPFDCNSIHSSHF